MAMASNGKSNGVNGLDHGDHGNDPEEVRYRIVDGEEMAKLRPLFDALGWALPDQDMAKVVVAEAGTGDKAVICGFTVVQFILHAEPMWVHPSMRGTGIAEALVAQTVHYIEDDCHVKRWMAVAKEGSFAGRLIAAQGMTMIPGNVFVKMVPQVQT